MQRSGAPCRRAGMRSSRELVGANDPQIWARSLCLQDRRLPLTGQVLEDVSVEQRLVELPAMKVAHFPERRVGDDFLDAAAQRGAGQWRSLDRAGYRARRLFWAKYSASSSRQQRHVAVSPAVVGVHSTVGLSARTSLSASVNTYMKRHVTLLPSEHWNVV
jgi:hypothetical protein